MKKHILILVMLLIATASFTQPSRRTTNDKKTTGNEKRVEQRDRKSKPEERKATTRSRNKKTVSKPSVTRSRESKPANKSTVNKPSVTRSRESKPANRSTVNKPSVTRSREVRPDNRPSNNKADRPPRSDYSGSDRRQPVDGQPSRTGVDNNDRPDRPDRQDGPRERKPTQKPQQRPVTDRQKAGQPEHAKQKPPVYHSSRRFVEQRPVRYHYKRPPRPRKYRARWHPYRRPHRLDIFWSIEMRRDYYRFYPSVSYWRYSVGYRIPTISAYDALYYNGEVMNVYGRVYEVFYSGSTDEYFLYFGAYYPYHDFTVVLPGRVARRFNSYPEGYFEREHIIVTGLITNYNDSPEIVVKRASQIRVY